MAAYLLVIIVIGFYYMRRATSSTEEYFLGGRSLGPWVAALSAEASDMSGWLLMGLPGVAYWYGVSDAFWTALGLGLGTYLNWLLVSRRLRSYSVLLDNAITLPEYFSNRFHEKKKALLLISSVMLLVFFSVYVGSCFVTGGKLFATLFGYDYKLMMIVSALFVVAYTLLGGFLAESVSDLMQAFVMIFALLALLIGMVVRAGGIGELSANISGIPGFLNFFGIASPAVEGGAQVVTDGVAQWNTPGAYGWLTIISTMAWGLGYFGMPQVLLRFMAIRRASELKRSRRIATVWCFIAMAAAVAIGLFGRGFAETMTHPDLLTSAGAEKVFIIAAQSLFHPLVAGIIMAGILAAAMSSSDSYLLIASSAISRNIIDELILRGTLKRQVSDKTVLLISRVTVCLVAVFGILIALDENSVIFQVVSFAWAGFGATFGPLVLFSLFWKRVNWPGAVAGMLGGGCMVFFWKFVMRPMGGVLNIYELLPAFLFSALLIVAVSLATKAPSEAIQKEFDQAAAYREA